MTGKGKRAGTEKNKERNTENYLEMLQKRGTLQIDRQENPKGQWEKKKEEVSKFEKRDVLKWEWDHFEIFFLQLRLRSGIEKKLCGK